MIGGLVAVLSISFLIFFIFARQKQNKLIVQQKVMKGEFEKQLLRSQIEVQEATYSTLGKDLHDNIGQLLGTAKMLIGLTERSINPVPETLITANETIGKAISELRSLSKSLNKEWLQQFDLIDNLKLEVRRINLSKTLKLHFLHPETLLINTDEQIILFRIIQEAIQNAIKHSNATNIFVNVSIETSVLQISIQDDGSGFEKGSIVNGVGIINMKQRASLLGATIKWVENKQGTTVRIALPTKYDQI